MIFGRKKMYVMLDEDGRVTDVLDEDIDDREDLDDEGKTWLHEQFPVYVKNRDLVMTTPMFSNRDFVVEDGIARFDPLPESVAAMAEAERGEALPGTVDELDEAVCSLYEALLAAQDAMDQQDEALCALYEAQLGGE